MPIEQMQKTLADLQAKQDLHELNARYCCGVDRRDRELLESLWWPEARIDFGLFAGSAHEFCGLICADNPSLEISYHFVSNELFEIDGDQATGKSYVIGVTCQVVDGERRDQLVGGRYLDSYARRNGLWRFSHRLFVIDWNINQPGSAIWEHGIGAMAARGQFAPADVSYGLADRH